MLPCGVRLHKPPKGIADNIQRHKVLRRVMMKVMLDNKLDLLIQMHTTLQPSRRRVPQPMFPALPGEP